MLIFPLKKEWYEKIKSGEKTVEYREVKPYWNHRIKKEIQRVYDNYRFFNEEGAWIDFCNILLDCKLRFGYTNRYMTAKITTIKIVDGKDTDLHIDKPVYAIHLTDVKECKQ